MNIDNKKNNELVHSMPPLLSSIANLLWPLIVIGVLIALVAPISTFINDTLSDPTRGSNVKVKLGDIEVSVASAVKQEAQASSQLIKEVKRLNSKVKELELAHRYSQLESFIPSGEQFSGMEQKSWPHNVKSLTSQFSQFSALDFSSPLVAGDIQTVLWVEDTPENSAVIIKNLSDVGIRVKVVLSTSDAINELLTNDYSLVITDGGRNEPPNGGEKNKEAGLDLLREIKKQSVKIPVLMFTSHKNLEGEAYRLGARAVTVSQNELLTMVIQNECREACKSSVAIGNG